MRPSQRDASQIRPLKITRNYIRHAEGSVLIEAGDTRVICTASVEEGVPSLARITGAGTDSQGAQTGAHVGTREHPFSPPAGVLLCESL